MKNNSSRNKAAEAIVWSITTLGLLTTVGMVVIVSHFVWKYW